MASAKASYVSFMSEEGDYPLDSRDVADGSNSTPSSSRRRSFTDEEPKATSVVTLKKNDGSSWGLVLSGGVDKESRARVSYLRPGGIAHRSDQLEVGDYIISVNGRRTPQLRYDQVANLLRNSGDEVKLEVEYVLPEPPESSSFSVMCKRIEVTLDKEGSTFGFVLRGGIHGDPVRCRPLVITQVRLGSSADREGTIKIGDRLLAINGVKVTQCTLSEALSLLRNSNQEARFLIEYDVSVLEAVQNATGPLLVEIDKAPGSNLGITLSAGSLVNGHPVLKIDSVVPASIADRCGALHVGDHILSVDDASVQHLTVGKATHLLKYNVSDVVRLQIQPMHKSMANGTLTKQPSPSLTSFTSLQSSATCTSLTTQVGSAISNPGQSNTGSLRSQQSTTLRSTGWNSRQRRSSNSSLASMGTNYSTATLTKHGPHVCHQEVTEVLIHGDPQKGFGLTLDSGGHLQEELIDPPIISHIEPKSSAERCGVLQEGDRVLAINGQYLEHRSLQEALEMLNELRSKVIITVEFDVAESIVPSSGIFAVKLPKRGAGLGITISASSNRKDSEPLIISDVKKGSVAHRTGTIQPGDRLVAIGNVRMDNCTLEDAAQVLQNTEDIVKLKIQKDEDFVDEPDPKTSIVFTVELPKTSGPLGITIDGSEEPFTPVVVSGLQPGSIAHKTGALRVGDCLMAINGESLRGQPLSRAIQLMQNTNDVLTLKITRRSSDKGERNGSGQSHDSVDSALESWDSSGLDSVKPGSRPTSDEIQQHHMHDASSCSSSGAHSAGTKDGSVEHPDTPPQGATSFNDLDGQFETPTPSNYADAPHSMTSSIDEWSKQLDELDKLRNSDLVINETAEAAAGGANSDANSDCFPPPPPPLQIPNREYLLPPDARRTRVPIQIHRPVDTSDLTDELSAAMDELSAIGGLTAITAVTDFDDRVRPKPIAVTDSCPENSVMTAAMHLQEVEEQLQNIFTPTPMELFKANLCKLRDSEDFGFGLSDGVYEKGVYLSAIRPGGPADRSGVLRQFDRVLQVNGIKTKDLDCQQVVPLIIQSGNQVELVVSRNPLAATMSLVNLQHKQSVQFSSKTQVKRLGGSSSSIIDEEEDGVWEPQDLQPNQRNV
ncbi:hypothetical protein CAPTEDRAFT_224220 [Capitella teleta]|uniref:PDZ domain-containing protein n=1 Tax=Capitella teleta TaxID=283909 RepID=R7U344_CAPTE|nr:hypothetical protein CAPTEDRAFT_224220 [Capitella teleta]|eukprot:ELU00765.1 hypothetical protein CAPTEDRAFT_224220 [Capitella teleta]